jgi:transposase InsO family protein
MIGGKIPTSLLPTNGRAGRGDTMQSKDIAKKLVREAVQIYNQQRLHMSLNYRTPVSVYATG